MRILMFMQTCAYIVSRERDGSRHLSCQQPRLHLLLSAIFIVAFGGTASAQNASVMAGAFSVPGTANFQDAVIPGDTLQLSFILQNNDTATNTQLSGITFTLNTVSAGNGFNNITGNSFRYYQLRSATGVFLGQTAGGGGTTITIAAAGAPMTTANGGQNLFYLILATETTAAQSSFDVVVSVPLGGGVTAAPVAVQSHSFTSSTLEILRPSVAKTGPFGTTDHVYGANSGPFQIFDWTIRNRASGSSFTYTGGTVSCTNVRGFVPGAQANSQLSPLGFTGDIEAFTTVANGVTHTFARRGTPTTPQLRNWSTPAPYYRIFIPTDTATDIAAGATVPFTFSFSTNAYMSDIPAPGGVVPGDAFYISFDSVAVSISSNGSAFLKNTNSSNIATSVPTTSMCYLVMGPLTATNIVAHPHLDATNSSFADGDDLEFITYRPMFQFALTGGPGNTQGLRSVRLNIGAKAGTNFNSETSPLRRIDQTDNSGLQIRSNFDGTYSMTDQLYSLDVSNTLITQNSANSSTVDLVVSGFLPLATDQSLDLTTTGYPRVWIGVEPSVNAAFGDSLTFEVAQAGLGFLSGLYVYDTHPQSKLSGFDTYVQGFLKLDSQQVVSPLVDTARLTFGMPVIFHDLTTSGQAVPPSSQPTAVFGLNIFDSGAGARVNDAVFFIMDAGASGGDPIHDVDFAALVNDSRSGWALYKDNDSDPRNNNGVFDPGIDTFVPFAGVNANTTRFVPVGNAYAASTLSTYGATNQPLIVRLSFDSTSPDATVPPDDLGGNSGDDFFLVCRTSATITPRDKFSVVLGDIDPTIVNSVFGGISFETTGAIFDPGPDRVFSRSTITRFDHNFYLTYPLAGASDPLNDLVYSSAPSSDVMRSEVVGVNGGTAVNVNNLIIGPKNVFRGNQLAVFGMNAIDTSGGISLVSLLVDAIDSGLTFGDFDTRFDLAPFKTAAITKGYGLAVFQDNGDSTGVFDAKDSVIPGVWSIDTAAGPLTRFKFTFSPAFDIPDTDVGVNAGNDIFVVATFGDSLLFKDDFVFRIPDNAFVFAPPGIISQPPPATTSLLVGGMPTKLIDLPDSGVLPSDGTRIAVIGIMAADTTFTGGGTVLLDKIRLRLDDPTAPGGFPTAILQSLTSDSTSGISVWIDGNGNRQFDDNLALDTPIPVSSFTFQSANILDLDLVNANGPVPDTDPFNFRSDTAAVYFIVLRASPSGLDHQVQVTIQAVTDPTDPWVKFTAATDRSQSLTPNALTIAPAGVSGTFSPTIFSPNADGVTDTVRVNFTIIPGNTDSRWSLFATKISSATSQTLGTGAFDTTVIIAKNGAAGNPVTFAWPSAFLGGGAFNLSFTYDQAGTTKTFQFSDTLLADLFCTAPILISTLPTVVTTGNTVAVSIAADSNRSSVDKFALTAGESAAAYYIYRLDGSVATLLAQGTLASFIASNVSVPLQGGNNTLIANLRDTYGNWSDTTTLGTVQLSVGSNQAIVQNLLTDPSRLWLGKGESTAVLGFNLTQDLPNEFVNAFTIQLFDSGGFAYGKNITDVPTTGAYPDTAGFLLYRDNTAGGTKGTWDTTDALVAMNPPQRNSSFTSGDTIRFVPQSPLSVPANDTSATTQGFDYFLVVYGNGGTFFRDSFVVGMPANTAFEFASASPTRSNLTTNVKTPPILTRIPRTFLDRTSAHDSITIGSKFTEIFGINVSDSTRHGEGGAALSSITLDFTIAAGDTFNPAILSYSVFRDSGSNNVGSFDVSTDSEVTTAVTFLSATKVKLTLSGPNADIPNSDAGDDSGPDFWVVIRPSVISLSQANKFTVAILPGNVVTTGDSPGGPGVAGSTKITIPAGGLSTSISPNPFSPNGDGFFDTAGYSISFADTRGFRLVLLRSTTGDTYYNKTGYAKDTTFVFASSDTTAWTTDEYKILITDTVSNTTSAEATLLVADNKALTPTLPTAPASSTNGTSISVTIRVSEIIDNSVQRATSRSERDSFALVFQVSNAVSGDTFDTAFSALTASAVDVTRTIPLFSGANTIRVTLIDHVGNRDSSLTFTVASAAAITGNIGFEGNSPLFRYSPSNPTFTFSFPTTVTGGTMEFFNIAGDRLRLINLTPGVTTVDWNAANDAGQTLRNGVYIIKFKVPLSNGKTIEESRTIFLLK